MENGPTYADPAQARARHQFGASLTSFIGREREATALSGLLKRAEIRLLTLTGPGGIGKTRLALRVAEDVAEDFPDGIWFVSLAGTRDPSLVLPAIAETLNIREAGLPLAEGLALHLRNKCCLLILDNFEHVIEAAPSVASVLQSCPLLSCLVTSRTVLRLSGEHAFPLPPLPLPPKSLTTTRQRASLSPAVQLFVARAQAAQPEFTLTDANAIDIEMICRQLEGLPLGIELAAARIRHLSLSELAEQLGSDRHASLRVLTGGPRDAPDRHRALRHAIAWSYDLLDADACSLFRRLGVFIDGFTASAAEAVALAIPGINIDVVEGISSLVDQSLLQRENNPIGTSRYRMLETIREFALEKLAMSGELPGIEAAHTAHFLSLVELASPELHSEQQAMWLRRLASDHGNVRSALGRCERQGDAALGLRFAAALWRFWHRQGYWEEGRRWLTRLLALVEPHTKVDHVAHASALTGAGWLAHYQNDFAAATTLLEEGLALYRQIGRDDNLAEVLLCRGLAARSIGETRRANDSFEEAVLLSRKLGDLPRIAESLFHLSFIARELGDYERAGTLCEEGLALHQGAGHLDGKALALLGLGDIARDLAQPAAVRRWCEESLAMFRDLGEPLGEGFSLHNLALAAYQDGDLVEARALCEASLSNFRRLGVEAAMAEVLASLGSILNAAGDTEAALASLTEALHLSTRVGPRWLVASSLEGIAIIAVRNRQDRVAVELASRAEALRAELHVPVRPNWQGELEDALSSARSALGAKAFAAAWEAGHGRSIDHVIADATAVKPCPIPSQVQGDRLKQSRHAHNLSPRELEVLRFLAMGRSDREIADALFISRRTASKHVGAILSKLGVESRTEATARAIRESLI